MGQEKRQGYENCILAFAVTGVSALLMGIFFDFYFDLNDDTMMRDIMAGLYSGVPDGHNMQTLYPLGAALALCYRLCREIPWYGLFLFLCQFGCFFLLGLRLCGAVDDFSASQADKTGHRYAKMGLKAAILLGLAIMMWGTWLLHMVNMQYTITCAILCAAAVFRFMTTLRGTGAGRFVRDNIVSVLLVVLAFQLRSEMLLLTLPFMAFAMWFCWWEESPFLSAKKMKKYGAVAGLMFLGMGLSLLIDSAAYGSEEWKDFRRFFDARTTVYDFYQEVVTQDEYRDALCELGVSPAKQTLLRNYNFGLDEEIDTGMLEEVASYAADSVGGARDWGKIFKDSLLFYRYRTVHLDDAPYNLLVLLGYAANAILYVILFLEERKTSVGESAGKNVPISETAGKQPVGRLLWRMAQLAMLFAMRSALWLFILVRGRDPERITHSLYLVEFVLLAGMLIRCLAGRWERRGRFLLCGLAVLFLLVSLGNFPGIVRAAQADQVRREGILRDWQAIDFYCRTHSESFYFEDVYSTVAFSGKLFAKGGKSPANYDIAGGWMCKSPLYREKLSHFGIETAQEALTGSGVYFIMSDAEAKERGVDWLTDFYAERELDAEIEESDRINENFGVYRIRTSE